MTYKSTHTNNHANPPETPIGNKLSIGTALQMIRRRWLVSSAIALLVSAAVACFLITREPVYESSASLVVEINEDQITDMQEVVDTGLDQGMTETIMNTHAERLKNRAFSKRIADQLSSSEIDLIYQSAPAGLNQSQVTTAEILSSEIMEIEWIPDTQVIEVAAQTKDAALSQKLARLYSENYVQAILEQRDSSNVRAVDFLDIQAEKLRTAISESEQELQTYRANNNLVNLEENQNIVANKLNQLNSELTEERIRIIGLESTVAEIEEAGSEREKLLAISEIGSYKSIPDLTHELEKIRSQRKILDETYLEEHPKIKNIQTEENAILSAIDSAIAQSAESIRSKLNEARRRETQMTESLAQAEAEAQKLDQLAIKHNVLERRLDTQKKTYDQLAQRLNETSIARQLQNTNIRILDPASEPMEPVRPDPETIAVASALIFGFFFFTVPVLWEGMDTRLRTFAEIEGYIGKPVLGHIQQKRKIKKRPALEQMDDVEVLEEFRSIFAQIFYEREPGPLRLMVSSTSPGEGKSFVSMNLAQICARHGQKTILVDADLRRSSLHKSFGLEKTGGLAIWGKSESKSYNFLSITEISKNLYLLPSGNNSTESTEIIQSSDFIDLMSHLKKNFDTVIVDTPPVGPCPDALLIARTVDMTLFVASQGANTRHRVRAAVRKLDQTKAPVLGLVLNKIVGRTAQNPYANYHSDYEYAYGYKPYYTADTRKSDAAVSRNGTSGSNGKSRLTSSLTESSSAK